MFLVYGILLPMYTLKIINNHDINPSEYHQKEFFKTHPYKNIINTTLIRGIKTSHYSIFILLQMTLSGDLLWHKKKEGRKGQLGTPHCKNQGVKFLTPARNRKNNTLGVNFTSVHVRSTPTVSKYLNYRLMFESWCYTWWLNLRMRISKWIRAKSLDDSCHMI